jgi:GNAT superfamily N-acetyltransferase
VEIRDLTESEIALFLSFYQDSYPERDGTVSRFQSELRNPLLEAGSARGILAFEDGRIVGQLLIRPSEFISPDLKGRCYVGYDLFVHKEYRERGVGGLLVLDAVRRFAPYFTVGVSEMTRKMLLTLDMQVVGALDKYVWLRKSITTAVSIARGLTGKGAAGWHKRAYPELLTTLCGEFKLNLAPELAASERPVSSNAPLEFLRTVEFIRWRIMEHANSYALYTSSDERSVFFAVRICAWRGLRLVSVVDYRYPLGESRYLEAIIACSKQLSDYLATDGVITMSSHCEIDDTLRRCGFRKVGKPTMFMIPEQCVSDPNRIEARSAVLATMADGDTDLLFKAVCS